LKNTFNPKKTEPLQNSHSALAPDLCFLLCCVGRIEIHLADVQAHSAKSAADAAFVLEQEVHTGRKQAASAPSTSGWATGKTSTGSKYFSAADRRPVILFDGVCNMCNLGVNFMLDWDRNGQFRYAALQSEAGQKLLERSGRHPGEC
jgi:hypothetical protein